MNLINDTLTYEFSQDTLRLTVDLAMNSISQNSGSGIIDKAWIPVVGMTMVALVTVISQSLITRKTTKTEFEKIKMQIQSDFSSKTLFDWISNFRSIIAKLLTTVDPDFRGELDGNKMAKLILQAQLMLDDSNSEEKEFGSLLSKLGHYSTSVKIGDHMSEKGLLEVQAEVQESTKKLLKRKQFEASNIYEYKFGK